MKYMITIIENEKKSLESTYTFNSEEISLLAKLLREKQEILPLGLEKFYNELQDTIYNSLSLEEAKKLYS